MFYQDDGELLGTLQAQDPATQHMKLAVEMRRSEKRILADLKEYYSGSD